MKKLAAMLLALTLSMGLSASAFCAEQNTPPTAKAKKASHGKKSENKTADIVPMPADLQPSNTNSIFPIEGGTIVLKDAWVLLHQSDSRLLTLTPYEDPNGEKVLMLLLAENTPGSTDLTMATKLLALFRTQICAAEFDPEKALSYAKLFATSSGAAFSSTCKRGNKVLIYQIDAVQGTGDYKYGILMGLDHQGDLSDKETKELEARQIKRFQSLFLSAGPISERTEPDE